MELKVEILIFWEIIDTIVVNEYATREQQYVGLTLWLQVNTFLIISRGEKRMM